MSPATKNLCASIVHDPRYSELKNELYESRASTISYPAVKEVFEQLQSWAEEGQAEKLKASQPKAPEPKGSTDLDLQD